MALDGLVNEHGPLIETFQRLHPNTIQHAAEITRDMVDDKELKKIWFWTADFLMNTVEDEKGNLLTGEQVKDGEVFLYVAGRENNLIFQNIEEAVGQLRKNNNYHPTREGIQRVMASAKSGDTLKIRLSELKLMDEVESAIWTSSFAEAYGIYVVRDPDEQRSFEINIAKYLSMSFLPLASLNPTQKIFAERLLGQGLDFSHSIEMMNEEGASTTAFSVLGPEYVKKNVGEYGAVARPSFIYPIGMDFDFHADATSVDFPSVALRGVPKPVERYTHVCACNKKDSCRKKYGTNLIQKCCKDK